MLYSSNKVIEISDRSLKEAIEQLKNIDVTEGRNPSFSGLNGWIFEQSIHYCIKKELEYLNIRATYEDQYRLLGRVKIDLVINNIAIEIKAGGMFDSESADKYEKYRIEIENRNMKYFYITKGENYEPYRNKILEAMNGNAYFLDDENGWEQFVKNIVENIQGNK